MLNRPIMAASAVAPCTTHRRAVDFIAAGIADPVLGAISAAEIQICPQHAGTMSEGVLDKLMGEHPSSRFRLHAAPRIAGEHRHAIMSAANAHEHPDQARASARLSRRMGAAGYSIHAGKRGEGSLNQAFDNLKRLVDLFGCRVGIEGLYPAASNQWLLADWDDHQRLLDAGVDFVVDLSHFNIMARSMGRRDDVVAELLSSPHCIEVHLSSNNGIRDEHLPLAPKRAEWWQALLPLAHEDAVIFYEGVLRLPER